MKIINIKELDSDSGSMYRAPADLYEVEFQDGEKVEVRVDNSVTALGLCYQDSESHNEYGKAAVEIVSNFM